jgi:hypothetical protein
LADTRGIEQDELHKKSIATEIQKHIDSVTTVLILADGRISRNNIRTDYSLTTLSSIFPKSVANNFAFMFTNVLSPLSWNFSQESVPAVLKGAPQFLLDNPIALQKKFLKLKGDRNMKMARTEMHKAVGASEEKALEMLVDLFDWMDGLEPHPTTEIVHLYEMAQTIEIEITNTLAQMEQTAGKKAEIEKLMIDLKNNSDVGSSPCLHLGSSLRPLDAGYERFRQLRENHQYSRLAEKAHVY